MYIWFVFFKLFFTYVNQLLHSSLYFKVWNRQSCFGKTNCIVFLLIVYIDISFIVMLIITELMADYLLTRAISLYPHYLFLCNRPVWIPINQVTAWFNQMLSYFFLIAESLNTNDRMSMNGLVYQAYCQRPHWSWTGRRPISDEVFTVCR